MPDAPSGAPDVSAEQRAHWDRVARSWAKWWPLIEVGARPVSRRLLDLARVAPGDRVLDLACGIGEPALSAAERVGAEGSVTAVDLAPTMLEIGRARAREAGVEGIAFLEMDAAAPDFPAASFDVVLSRWGLMFVPELEPTLERVFGLLGQGGRFAMAVWGRPEEVPSISLVGRVLARELDLPPALVGARSPFDLADLEGLRKTLEGAGFEGFESAEITVRNSFASVEEYLRFRADLSAPDPRLDDVPEARLAEAYEAVRAEILAFRQGDGRVVMDNRAICVAAERR